MRIVFAFKASDLIYLRTERFKPDGIHRRFNSGGLFLIALAEERKRQVEVLRRGEIPAHRARTQFIPQGKKTRPYFIIEVNRYKQPQLIVITPGNQANRRQQK
jgi:hypothetical protein